MKYICLLVMTAILSLPVSGSDAKQAHLLCCGMEEVFLLQKNSGEKLWSWRASDSPEIPKQLYSQFHTTADCKPYPQQLLLIVSSSSGVALIQRDTKKCLFYASARNAHSACLLPQNRIAVASSTGGDQLLVFSRNQSGYPPLTSIPLKGAHGVHWDKQSGVLWALGDDELLRCNIAEKDGKVSIIVKKRWKLPSYGGHDLSPVAGKKAFYITTNSQVYQFNTDTGQFSIFTPMKGFALVKSVDQMTINGSIVFHQATSQNWWSHTIRFAGTDTILHLKNKKLYKVRWDRPLKN